MCTDEFTSRKTKKVFKMKLAATTKSSTIVYLITCRRCSQQYVGKTGQPLNCRINSHRSDNRQRKTEVFPVAEHFNGEGHTLPDLTVMVIDQLYSHNTCLRKILESKSIRTLGTSHPFIMNLGWIVCDTCAMTIWAPLGFCPTDSKATGYPRRQ